MGLGVAWLGGGRGRASTGPGRSTPCARHGSVFVLSWST